MYSFLLAILAFAVLLFQKWRYTPSHLPPDAKRLPGPRGMYKPVLSVDGHPPILAPIQSNPIIMDRRI